MSTKGNDHCKLLWTSQTNLGRFRKFDQVKSCTCGKCICNLGAVLAKKQEDEKVHTFLKYSCTRSAAEFEQSVLYSHSRRKSQDDDA